MDLDPTPQDWQTFGLPRARGDGPPALGSIRSLAEASPRSRGWTRGAGLSAPGIHGFPALAGMDPFLGSHWRAAYGLPRARGDGPRRISAGLLRGTASPRSRGWTRPRSPRAPPVGGFPALAGMDPSHPGAHQAPSGLPRARGDGPRVSTLRHVWETASPRSRGWTPALGWWRTTGRGFPALAGMDPHRTRRRTIVARLPRARGDGPVSWSIRLGESRASPRSRGWTRELGLRRRRVAGFPALAGMDPAAWRGSRR